MSTNSRENAKVRRAYARFLKEAQGKDVKTQDRALPAIRDFEEITGRKPFKAFHIDQAVRFEAYLAQRSNKKSSCGVSASTIDVTLRMTKQFFIWLAGRPGYKSRISYADAEYIGNTLKDACVAQISNLRQVPSLDQVRHALARMPQETHLQISDHALLALLTLAGARIEAVTSLRVKHLVIDWQRLFQEAREVRMKNGKTMTRPSSP